MKEHLNTEINFKNLLLYVILHGLHLEKNIATYLITNYIVPFMKY